MVLKLHVHNYVARTDVYPLLLRYVCMRNQKVHTLPRGSTKPLFQAAKVSGCDSGRPRFKLPVVTG